MKLLSIKYLLVGPETPPLPYEGKLAFVAKFKEYTLKEYRDALPHHFFPRAIEWGVPSPQVKAKTLDERANPLALSYSTSVGAPYHLPTGCVPAVRMTPLKSASDTTLGVTNPCVVPVFLSVPANNYPWWRLSLDGKSVKKIPANLVQQLIEIPPGEHELTFRCVPVTWYLGIGVSVLTFFTTVMFLARYRFSHVFRRKLVVPLPIPRVS